MNESLYPPSVQGAPPELTRPSRAYQRQVIIVLLCLTIFVLFYLSLIIGSGWLAFYGINQGFDALSEYAPTHSQVNNYFVLGVVSIILFLFLVKSLFKWKKEEKELRIEITQEEQPELFDFIRRICAETKTPMPYRVFLTHDVNAAVFYNSSLLSLIFPVKKNLLIGLGLVNGLNLSEFKAVLAHEFGHFSQGSMRLGSYVYMANHIVYDLVYQRDVFDDLLASAKRSNARIAIFAYLVAALLWILRKILQGAFHLINFFQSALSRQMEFHADLVAVSITGSDSLIHALKRLDFLQACLIQAFADLRQAADQKLYTTDLYYHQSRATEHLRRIVNDPEAGNVPALPEDPKQKTQLFTSEDADSEGEGMWASHPSHYLREENAKRCYLRSIEDTRSPWLLFRNANTLRNQMTTRFYQQALEKNNLTFTPAEQVQDYIDAEHAETKQDERYQGMYDGRLLTIPTESLTEYANGPSVQGMQTEQIEALLKKLYNAEYADWMEAHRKRREERRLLSALEAGELKLKGAHFTFREGRYTQSDINPLRIQVEAELEADAEWLKAFDREVFVTHLRMAQIVNEGDQELYQRYLFHLQLQDTLRVAQMEENRLQSLFQFLGSKESGLSKNEYAQALAAITESHRNICDAYIKTRSLSLPAFQNMQPGLRFSEYLLQEPLLAKQMDQTKIDGHWASALGKQVSEIEERCRRLYFKSMGTILSLQEQIAERYRERVPGEPTDSAGVAP